MGWCQRTRWVALSREATTPVQLNGAAAVTRAQRDADPQAYTLFLAREHAEDFMAHPVLARHITEGRLWLICDNFGPARIR